MASVYGLEELPLHGELDYEKLATGKYILGVLDDNNELKMNRIHFALGETVTLHKYKGTSEEFTDREYTMREFTVLG